MKTLKLFFFFLLFASCQKKEVIDNPDEKFVWPTNKWSTKAAADVKMETSYLDNLNAKINKGDYDNVHSLLIVKDGFLVFENYYNGSSVGKAHELQSATKSIASILCGIAMDKNYFSATDFVLNNIDNSYTHSNNINRDNITIENLLNMKLGIDWKEWGYPTAQQDNVIMANSPDWIQYLLNQPMTTNKPGTSFLYNTGASAFISAMIDEKTPLSTLNFGQQYLFKPIGISSQDWWVKDSKGIVHTGGGLKLTAQDMARFGFLILKNGKWNGSQIISENYLSKIAKPSELNVLSVPVNSSPQVLHYSHHWWNIPIVVNGKSYNIISALGTGGQAIFIIKELNMVVVSTAWNLSEPNQTSAPIEWLVNYIIPAAQ